MRACKNMEPIAYLLQEATQVLFTATPFRRDEKEIKGKFVFSYDLRG